MSANLSNSTLVVPVYPWAVQGSYILDIIINRSIGGIGILVNLFFVILLSHRNLHHKIYDFLWCRQFTSLLTCLFETASYRSCFACKYNSEWLAYYSWYTQNIVRAFLLSSLISDLLLIYTRYFEIIKKPTFLRRLSKKFNLFICSSISCALSLPTYFAVNVEKDHLNGNFHLTLNALGVSIYYKLFVFLVFLLEFVIPVSTLLWMNGVSVYKFKHVMDRHADLTGNQIETRKSEHRFTRMVLLLSVITSVTRLIDMAIAIPARISVISPRTFGQGTLELILFSKSLSVILINIALAFDALVYLRMDKNIWELILSFTGRNNRVILLVF